MTYPVESWIVRCDLRQMPLAFTELVAGLPGNILANGIAISTDGESLYVANSGPSISTGIYRVPTDAAGDGSKAGLWCRPPRLQAQWIEGQGPDTLLHGQHHTGRRAR
jgi:sugar lactone lactonase YvrE